MPAIDVRKVRKVEGQRVYPSAWEFIIGEIAYDNVYISPTAAPVEVTTHNNEIRREIVRCCFSDISANIKTLDRLVFRLVNHPHLFHLIKIERVSSNTYKVRLGSWR